MKTFEIIAANGNRYKIVADHYVVGGSKEFVTNRDTIYFYAEDGTVAATAVTRNVVLIAPLGEIT